MERDGVSAGADSGDHAVSVETAVARTFLIVDVRGYTHFTQTYGDEAAGNLASQFAALVREAISATRGEVLELLTLRRLPVEDVLSVDRDRDARRPVNLRCCTWSSRSASREPTEAGRD